MRSAKTLAAALAVGLGFVAAGCGAGGGSVPFGAVIAPKTAPVFISIETKPGSAQLKRALALVRGFPGGANALAQPGTKAALAAVGNEVDLVWVDLQNGGDDFVALTKPRNTAKLDAALAKGKSVHAVVDGWTVIAKSRAILARFEEARKDGSLGGDSTFKHAFRRLPTDAFAKVFVSGRVAERGLPSSASGVVAASLAGKLDSIGAALVPVGNGVKLNVDLNGNLPGSPATFKPTLPSQLPSGALAYVFFSNLESSLKTALKQYPQLSQAEAQLETLAGFSIQKDLLPLFAGEGALAVYPGQKQPAVDVVFKITNTNSAFRVLNGLRLLTQFSKGVEVTQSKGIWRIAPPGAKTVISVALRKALLIVTDQASSITAIQGAAVKLADNPAYKAAVSRAALPAKTSGFVYLNAPTFVNYFLSRDAARTHRRLNPVVTGEFAHLGGLLLYANKHGGNYDFTGFQTIK